MTTKPPNPSGAAAASRFGQRLERLVLRFTQGHGLFAGQKRALLAVSGGPDSLALLHLMREVRDRSYSRLTLHVGHLHHGMRGEAADEDARFVASEAARLGYRRAVIPAGNARHAEVPKSIEVVGVETVGDALDRLF